MIHIRRQGETIPAGLSFQWCNGGLIVRIRTKRLHTVTRLRFWPPQFYSYMVRL